MQKQPELRLPRGVLASPLFQSGLGVRGRQAPVPPEREAGRSEEQRRVGEAAAAALPAEGGVVRKRGTSRRKEDRFPFWSGSRWIKRGGPLFPIPARLPLAQGSPEAEPFAPQGQAEEHFRTCFFVCLGDPIYLGSRDFYPGLLGIRLRLLNQAAKSFSAAAFAACPFSPT